MPLFLANFKTLSQILYYINVELKKIHTEYVWRWFLKILSIQWAQRLQEKHDVSYRNTVVVFLFFNIF